MRGERAAAISRSLYFLMTFTAPSLESCPQTRSALAAPHPREPWQSRGLDLWGGPSSPAPLWVEVSGGGRGGLPCRPLRSRCHTAGRERGESASRITPTQGRQGLAERGGLSEGLRGAGEADAPTTGQKLGPRVSHEAPATPGTASPPSWDRPLPCDPLGPPPTGWFPGRKSLCSWAVGTAHTPHTSRGPRMGTVGTGSRAPLGKDTEAQSQQPWQGGRGAEGPGPLGQARGAGCGHSTTRRGLGINHSTRQLGWLRHVGNHANKSLFPIVSTQSFKKKDCSSRNHSNFPLKEHKKKK